mmetsp:Transcript_182190/g.443361  ORF Transcript_182190/g.443361 Transcript_182190/m.443361 type:complete len:290 (+) Transcript_182190:51-920(+)
MSTRGLDSIDYTSIEQVCIASRWECDVCLECFAGDQTCWRLDDYGENCCHVFCKACAVSCFQWGGQCPWDGTEFPQRVVCGVMTTGQYVSELKRKEATRTGGVICCNPDCHGVAPAAEGKRPRQVRCPECGAQHCGRRVCGALWTAGHRCWDLVEEERLREEQARQRREEERQRREGAPRPAGRTLSLLEAAPRCRACPGCGVMVERDGGCNMVYHPLCKTRWCFACGGMGCQDFDCRGSSARPSGTSSVREGLQAGTAEPGGASQGARRGRLMRAVFALVGRLCCGVV